MRFILGGKAYEISREDILNVTKGVVPKGFDGRSRYFVELHGLEYPIKQPIHLVTGLSYTGGFTAQDAHRILTKLGYLVKELPLGFNFVPPQGNVSKQTSVNEGTYRFAITLKPGENGYIIVGCPALPGCHSQGRTEEEAISNIREAIRGYIASMKRHGDEIPVLTEVREIEVAV